MLVVKVAVSLLTLLVVAAIATVAFVYLAPETALRLATDAERRHAGLVRSELDLGGGVRYVYLEGGQGEPLMLLHGFGANKDTFTRVARHLTPHYRVIIPDHIGFGESSHPQEADYSATAQAVRLHELAQALGIDQLHLGGNSMGGLIALSYATSYPGNVRSLWLLDSAGLHSAPESELRKVIRETGANPLLAQDATEFARLVAFAMSDPPFIPRPMLDVMAQERVRNFQLERRIFASLAADAIEGRITGLETPALIVWGDEDRALHVATAEILRKLLPRSQVKIMRGVGHLPMLERPQESAADYLGFRAGL